MKEVFPDPAALPQIRELSDQLALRWSSGAARPCPKHKTWDPECKECVRIGMAESKSRYPVVTIVHKDRKDETFVVSCPHGSSMTYTQTNNAEGLVEAGRQALNKHHAEFSCTCQIVSAEDYWIKLSDAQAQFADDLAIPLEQKQPPYNTPEAMARHAALANKIMAFACDGCEPGVAIELPGDYYEDTLPTLVHQKNCLRAKAGIFLEAIDATWAEHTHERLVLIDGARRSDA